MKLTCEKWHMKNEIIYIMVFIQHFLPYFSPPYCAQWSLLPCSWLNHCSKSTYPLWNHENNYVMDCARYRPLCPFGCQLKNIWLSLPNSSHAPYQFLIPAMFHNILNDHNSSSFFSSREKFLVFWIYQKKMKKSCCANR